MTSDLAELSAAELVRLYRRREASPVEAVQACLLRIRELNGQFGAYCQVHEERALEDAAASAARWAAGQPQGPVDGVPTSIKDLILVKGWATRRGSLTTDDEPPADEDAPAVARLRAAGAVLLGKTTTPEFGWKGVTDNPRGEVARNPWNPAMTPGGSSGGAAVAAALGMGALHIGTDGGGSIRIPAGFTGIVGHKPTFGRVAAWPASLFGTVAHLGPMTRTVTDAALMLNVMSGPDARDWLSLPEDGTDYLIGLEAGVQGLRIAFSPSLGYARVDPEVAAAVEAAAQLFVDLGATVETADPGFSSPAELFERTWFPAAALVVDGITPDKRPMLDPGLRRVAETGARLSGIDVYRTAKLRADLAIQMQRFFDKYDVLLTPTLPITAFPAGQETPDAGPAGEWVDWTPFSYPFNLSQQPAVSVPCGLARNGLPVGLQIVGPKYADALVLRAARAFESAKSFPMPRPANLA
jgi:aspartyl-tRNA(Asn)/glutamyl-tRNA(Gln) amidotransferase subunit A